MAGTLQADIACAGSMRVLREQKCISRNTTARAGVFLCRELCVDSVPGFGCAFQAQGRIGGFDRFVVFAAYFDESATGTARSGIVAVAACMARAHAWLAFDHVWRPILSQSGLAGEFHALLNDPDERTRFANP
jgi:hypothetical protein